MPNGGVDFQAAGWCRPAARESRLAAFGTAGFRLCETLACGSTTAKLGRGAEWRLRTIEAAERRPALRLAWRPAKETRRCFLGIGFTPDVHANLLELMNIDVGKADALIIGLGQYDRRGGLDETSRGEPRADALMTLASLRLRRLAASVEECRYWPAFAQLN